jgi:hypothetical protein
LAAAAVFCRWPTGKYPVWTPQRVAWMGILMAWDAVNTLAGRFENIRSLLKGLFPRWRIGTSYNGFHDALMVHSVELVPAIVGRLRQFMQEMAGRFWLREGWCALAVDGSRVECPRTAANEAEFGCAAKRRTTPQLFLTTFWHMGLGLPWDFRVGPGTASERAHLHQMLPDLPPSSLIVADAGFVGYDVCWQIIDAKQAFLLRVGSNVKLLSELGYAHQEHDGIVYLWPQNRHDEPPLVLRLIVVAGKKEKQNVYLLTNVLDESQLSDKTAAVLYQMRWGIEVFYRSYKQTMAKRKMLSRTPDAARCELTWTMLGLWFLAAMSVEQLIGRDIDPLSLSVALARDAVRRVMREALSPRRSHRGLDRQLQAAVKDGYHRRRSKKARDWPHKKTESPPSPPKITLATEKQKQQAKRLKAIEIAA